MYAQLCAKLRRKFDVWFLDTLLFVTVHTVCINSHLQVTYSFGIISSKRLSNDLKLFMKTSFSLFYQFLFIVVFNFSVMTIIIVYSLLPLPLFSLLCTLCFSIVLWEDDFLTFLYLYYIKKNRGNTLSMKAWYQHNVRKL